MKYEILGKNGFTPTDAIKTYAEKRLKKVVSFFEPNIITEVRVVCKVYKDSHKVEVTIPANGMMFRAEVSDTDMYAAIDKVVDKLTSQIRKHKEKVKSHFEKTGFSKVYTNEFDVESLEKEVIANQLVKNKQVTLQPMTSEEAISAMELIGHDFFVFLDKKTSRTNVVYRREDGDYAIIETQPE